jgi:hypothetical protein
VGKGALLGRPSGQNRARRSPSKTGVNALMGHAAVPQAILPTLRLIWIREIDLSGKPKTYAERPLRISRNLAASSSAAYGLLRS